jgi:hypothetical protein
MHRIFAVLIAGAVAQGCNDSPLPRTTQTLQVSPDRKARRDAARARAATSSASATRARVTSAEEGEALVRDAQYRAAMDDWRLQQAASNRALADELGLEGTRRQAFTSILAESLERRILFTNLLRRNRGAPPAEVRLLAASKGWIASDLEERTRPPKVQDRLRETLGDQGFDRYLALLERDK